ncbi:hypothetical protein AB0I00_34070 [Streptomyces sp. NPDC050803]|uniref:hypothetical protein n=1 Tax=unclassified Streptomyces TaxID=2593676 RepID=UPI00343B14A4
MDSQLSLLAEQAARLLVSTAGEPQWHAVGHRFVAIFAGREREVERRISDLARAVEDAAEESRDETRAQLLPGWVARLRLWLADEPDVAPALRELVEAFPATPGARGPDSGNIVVQQSVTGFTVLGGSLNIGLHGHNPRTSN